MHRGKADSANPRSSAPEVTELQRQFLKASEKGRCTHHSRAARGELINLLRTTGQIDEALDLATEKAVYTRQAGLGPWTQLLDEGKRLRILSDQGQYDQVLKEVQALRQRLTILPEISDQEETAIPWNVRETIFDTGRSAALQTTQWQAALDLNKLIKDSQVLRGATHLEQAKVAYNDYKPLLRLNRFSETRALLDDCRAVLSKRRT